jgi:UPF0755 protein
MWNGMLNIFKLVIGIIVSLIGLTLFMGLALTGVLVFMNSPPSFSADSMTGWDELLISLEDVDSNAALPSDDIAVRLEIRKGESAQSVGQRLADSGLIRSQLFWYLLCRFDKEHIKSGTFRIEIPASQIAIHNILVSGRQILLRITIPEGFTLNKTANLLEDAGICPAEEFLAAACDPEIIESFRIPGTSMEGYLYPDTYLFPSEYPAKKVVEAMADNFFTRINKIDENVMGMSPDELNNMVILASIVEREYRLDEEAPVMARVFFNRLKIGMALQSCATVEYIITELQGKPHPQVLLTRDTEIRDPFNTYINTGLPPGPISAPGAVALRAVLFPSDNNYLYFRLIDNNSGNHYFSNTFDDHIRAGTLYVKGPN